MNIVQLMRAFTIRQRMVGAIVVVLVMLLLVGSAGLFGMHRVESLSRHFLENSVAESTRLADLHDAMHRMRRAEKDMIIGYEDPQQVARGQQHWNEAWAQSGRVLSELQQHARAQDQAELAAIGQHLEDYRKVLLGVARQLADSGYDSATVAGRVMSRGVSAFDEGEKRLLALKQALAAEASGAAASAREASRQTLLLFGLAVLVAIAIVVPLTLLNMRSICGPLQQAQVLARAIAGGDLSPRALSAEGRDESAELLQALLEMQGALRRTVEQVHQSTSNLGTASAEIASGNQDLSGRTEQAAANLQQTASSMAQLTGTVRQSAEAARQANQLANSASSLATRGGEVVSQVVSTMDGIHAASKKIADIIGVIDGIAFQTNILALNAAVEAARAGEQGRGFAVVAGEVRNLAQRSAQAAKEIKTLIGASVEQVEGGARLVADAGETMQGIVGSVQRVADIIGEISAAASEQHQGIGQINQAVVQLDQMTQQNAALVEQSTAAAQSLREQTARLSALVGTFRTEAASSQAMAHAA